jgi:polysaccharide pyruvyl transferase WcaK-like protein
MSRVILWGGYGWGNVGDELTLAVAISDLKERGITSLGVLTPSPGYTRALFPEAEVIPFRPVVRKNRIRRSLEGVGRRLGGLKLPEPYLRPEFQTASEGNWVSALRDAELLYLAGGGYFTDLFAIFDRFILPVEVARLMGRRVETAPLGIGPFRDEKVVRRLVHAFKGTSLTVRDQVSVAFCRKHGLEASVGVDDGFRIGEVLEFGEQPAPGGDDVVLGVNFFPQHGSSNEAALRQWWLEFLRLAVSNNVTVEGFCFHNQLSYDFEPLVELFASAGLPPNSVKPPVLDFREACRDLTRYSMIASSRFHAVVVANVTGVPCLGVSSGEYYDAKMQVACEGSERARHVRLTSESPATAFEFLMAEHRKSL